MGVPLDKFPISAAPLDETIRKPYTWFSSAKIAAMLINEDGIA